MGRERGVPRRGRRSAAASRRGEEGMARFEEGGTPTVVDPPPNPWGAGVAEEPRLSAGVAEEPRPPVVPLLRVAADGLPCLDFAWPERREKRGGWGRRRLELDLAWLPRLTPDRRAEEMKTRPPHLCPQPALEATAAADRAGEGLSDAADVELRMRRGGRGGAGEDGAAEVASAGAGGAAVVGQGRPPDPAPPHIDQGRRENKMEGEGRRRCWDEGGSHSLVVGMKERFKGR
jgi:hypothetical protein